MFGKIKDRLKNVFKSSEDYVEDNHDKIEEVETEIEPVEEQVQDEETSIEPEVEVKEDHILKEEDIEDSSEIEKPKKKGFFGRLFGSKDEDEIESSVDTDSLDESEKDVSELKEIEEEMLDDVPESEKDALHNHEELSVGEVAENVAELEEKSKSEEKLEKDTMSEIIDSSKMDKISDDIEKSTSDKNIDEIKEIENDKVDEVFEKTRAKVEAIEKEEKKGFFSKLKAKTIDESDFDNIWVELQMFLLEINIAFEIVEKIEKTMKLELIGKSFNRFKLSEKIREVLETEVEEVLSSHEASFLDKLNSFDSESGPVKILVLGVNGTGKTTTIAKLVKYLKDNNKSVVVAAADTFRAAAVEQLEEHAKALNFKLIMNRAGGDPAAVAFDAIEHAKAKKIDVVLIDTAGRMPNNSNLMMELEKVKRVSKSDMAIFVGDCVSGNDLIEQIELFNKGVQVDGTILTKVDTDEKPGSVVTTAYSINKPIYFLGVGQGYDDLVVFNSSEIAKKLFDLDDE
ncbi:MAG: signal recognition particle-docking protein FtsY [Nanoarchaeales archaeon]|nr:signal recognition particle-docking protein FtsY [Nanoarchaeales archaeon]